MTIPTPDLETYPGEPAVSTVAVTDETVAVTWADGYEAAFHHIWLRDNCACGVCLDPVSRERLHGFLDLPPDPHPASASPTSGGLEVVWDDGHASCYHPGWLRAFDYHGGSRPSSERDVVTWGSGFDVPILDATEVMTDDHVRHELVEAVYRVGLVLVSDSDPALEAFEAFVARVGLMRNMNWKAIYEIDTTIDEAYIANRSTPIEPHTDAATREYQPGVTIFQCVANEVAGGESVWVDGFRLAELLQEHHRDAWELLSTVPWELANRSTETHYRWNAPVFDLWPDGRIRFVRDLNWLREPLRLDPELVPRMYAAYRTLAELKADPGNQIEHRLVAGEIALVDNRRVLHARHRFDQGSGRRCLRTSYVDHDELMSTIRLHARADSGRGRRAFRSRGT